MILQEYKREFNEQVIAVWERSVRATHHFLLKEDIEYFKSIVVMIDFTQFTVYCACPEQDTVAGFIGVLNQKIEMLFVDPTYIGKGIGKQLTNFAINSLQATAVDVNEQNTQAVNFYTHLGFVTYERMPTDSEGKEYPILKMRLANNASSSS